MNITIENKKQKALEIMKTLDIYKPYIKGFEKDNHVCFFEGFGGFWAYQEPELMAKIKEIEKTYKVLVYAVTHEYLEFGECYDISLGLLHYSAFPLKMFVISRPPYIIRNIVTFNTSVSVR